MPLAARILVLTLALMAATCGQKGPLTPPAQGSLTEAPQTSDGSNAASIGAIIEVTGSA